MDSRDIKSVAVVGAGNMGHQIALLAAIGGYRVTCTDSSQAALTQAEQFADQYLPGRVAKGKLDKIEASRARGNLAFTPVLEEAVGSADLVIEAIVEVLDVKRELFAALDRLAPEDAILATNSSFIVSSKLATATSRPDKVVNLHFFNPALVMKLVEVVQGPHTSEETAQACLAFCQRLGKEAVLLRKEADGFLLNRILAAIYREACWLLEMGVATTEDIDRACMHGAGHPMGPFRLNDLTGLDLSYTMMMEKFRATGDAAELPPPSLVAHVMRGEYGKKTGRGWYSYGAEA